MTLLRFSDIPSGRRLEADICVVGAGAAGLAITREFLHSSHDVIVVEAGGARPGDGETRRASATAQAAAPGPRPGLGGTTQIWGGQCIRLSPVDFERRSWVPHSGWPWQAATLDAYYERAGELFGIPSSRWREDIWAEARVPRPRFESGALEAVFSIFSPRPERFLGRALRTELRTSKNVRVLLGASATRVLSSPDDRRVSAIELRSLGERTVRVEARLYVLCCGGIENARMLLVSTGAHPQGIGNEHDLVGRYFMEHVVGRFATIETERPEVLHRSLTTFYRGRLRFQPKLALSADAQATAGALNCAADLVVEYPEQSGMQAAARLLQVARERRDGQLVARDIASAVRGLPEVAAFAAGRFLRGRAPVRKRALLGLNILVEQAPNPSSRVRLSSRVDLRGVALPELDHRRTDLDRHTEKEFAGIVARAFSSAGIGDVKAAPWLELPDAVRGDAVWPIYHPSGTTRMAVDPRHGVVDPQGRVHSSANLYIAGSSTFPTVGFANPTLTIVALAIRLADHLKTELRRSRPALQASR